VNESCPSTEALLAAADRAGKDPLLEHAATCPRCRNELRLYREFLSGNPAVSTTERAEAVRRLASQLRSLAGEVRDPVEGPSTRSRPGNGFARLLEALRGPMLRPALGFAAVVLLVALVPLVGNWRERDRVVLRGAPSEGAFFEVRTRPDGRGGFEATWEPVSGADGYRVVLLDAELAEVKVLGRVTETRLAVPADSLPAGLARGEGLGVRVEALAGGAVRGWSWVGAVER